MGGWRQFRNTALIAGAGIAVIVVLWTSWKDSCRWGGSPREEVAGIPLAVGARAAAYRDVAAGELRLLSYGGGMPERALYGDLLERRLGIQFEIVASCTVSHTQRVRWGTYNAVMFREIDRRIGLASLDSILEEARRKYEKERAARILRRAANGV